MHLRMMSLVALLCCALSACKVLPTAHAGAQGNTGGGGDAAFNAGDKVAAIWDAKVLPYLEHKAGAFQDVRALAARSPDEAGARYGFRATEGSTPWTLVVKLTGKIVEANTTSRAGTIGVDVDGDGRADVIVQIGPAVRGTALRDSLDFVNFNDFTNQIDFAQFGKAFNQHLDKTLLSSLPREGLVGKTVTVVGAY